MPWLYQPLLPATAEIESGPAVGPISPAYWVGGSGTWDATDPTNWAATSGGPGGAGYPDATSNVIFDSNSNVGTGSFTVTVNGGVCNDMTVSGLDGAMTLTIAAASTLSVYGSMTTPATNFSITNGDANSILDFLAVTSETIDANGAIWDTNTRFNGVGGTWTLLSNLTVNTTKATIHFNGTVSLNDHILTTGNFGCGNSNVRTINFGTSGEIVVNTDTAGFGFNINTVTNLTISGAYPIVRIQGSANVTRSLSLTSSAEVRKLNWFIENTSGTASFGLAAEVNDITINNNSITVSSLALDVYGNFTVLGTSPTLDITNLLSFKATSGTKTITSGGESFAFPIRFDGVGGTWQLQDNTTMNSTTTLANGTLDLNGKTLTLLFTLVTAAGTKNITFNGGTILCTATGVSAFNNAQPTGFTTTAGTGIGKISLSGATAKTFAGGGSTYNCLLENSGAGALTITGSNTFEGITNSVQPTTFTFTAGTTTTVNSFTVSGTAGNLVTINSTGGTFTLSKSSGTVSVSYCTISNSTATGGAEWQAYTTNGNQDGGGNTGWIFIAPNVYVTIDNNVVLGAGILISF